jgi:hypothetical protein
MVNIASRPYPADVAAVISAASRVFAPLRWQMKKAILCWVVLRAGLGDKEHVISTEHFGRAYSEVWAAYFTHKPADIAHQTPKRKEEVENKTIFRPS